MNRMVLLCLACGVLLQAGCSKLGDTPPRRPVPVRAALRPSLVNNTLVVVLLNETPHQLAVDVGLKRGGQILVMATVPISANGTKEIGWMEGFPFQPGDILVLEHPEYTPVQLEVPSSQGAPAPATQPEAKRESP